jgi:hypothetical protein
MRELCAIMMREMSRMQLPMQFRMWELCRLCILPTSYVSTPSGSDGAERVGALPAANDGCPAGSPWPDDPRGGSSIGVRSSGLSAATTIGYVKEGIGLRAGVLSIVSTGG